MSKTHRRWRSAPPAERELRLDDGATLEAVLAAAWNMDPKSQRLCAQARRALEFAIETGCRDESLSSLVVLEVVPDPTVRRLRVWLRGPADMDIEGRNRVLQRLAAARGFLRSQVADAICRKRTPELAFELLRSPSQGEKA